MKKMARTVSTVSSERDGACPTQSPICASGLHDVCTAAYQKNRHRIVQETILVNHFLDI